jgi:Holliday junction resolvase RusA-like endonuclease
VIDKEPILTELFPDSNLVEFEVTGRAASQGSIAYHSVEQPDGSLKYRGHHDSKTLKPWRRRVAANARIAMRGQSPWTGAIELTVTVCRPRPKAHYNSGGWLKDWAPDYPITEPDTLKQVRAIEDACTGIVWLNDSQITEHLLQKMFCSTAKVLITIRRKD